MQDDQNSQSVDGVVADDNANSQPQTSPTFSLGSTPVPQPQPASDESSGTENESNVPQPVELSNENPSQSSASSSDSPVITSAYEEQSTSTPEAVNANMSSSNDDELSELKKDAISKLAPLVSELDQEPEEKYRTLMLLIQSTDDQSLLKDAYETAGKIENKKLRAEAILGVINEIEYFTREKNVT